VAYQAVPYVWSYQFDPKLQILRRPSEADDGRCSATTGRLAVSLFSRNGPLVGAVLGISKLLVVMRPLIEGGTAIDQAVDVARE
jgi:hypothetical protein